MKSVMLKLAKIVVKRMILEAKSPSPCMAVVMTKVVVAVGTPKMI